MPLPEAAQRISGRRAEANSPFSRLSLTASAAFDAEDSAMRPEDCGKSVLAARPTNQTFSSNFAASPIAAPSPYCS
jgi:hypothetical protein